MSGPFGSMDPALMQAVMSDPEILSLVSRPHVMSRLQEIMANPATAAEHANDPDIQRIMQKLQALGIGGPGMPLPSAESNTQDYAGIVEIQSQSQFAQAVRSPGKLVVVDFYTTWCGPCQQIAPILKSMAKVYQRNVLFVKVDCDRQKAVAMAQGVRAYPTFHFYKSGTKVDEVQGADSQKLERLIEMHKPVDEGESVAPSPYRNFPLREDELVKYDTVKFAVIEEKMIEFNASKDLPEEARLTPEEISAAQSLLAILGDRTGYLKSHFSKEHCNVLCKLMEWPENLIPPILNIFRMVVYHPDGAKWIIENQIVDKLASMTRTFEASPLNQMILIQSISNMFGRKALRSVLAKNAESVLSLMAHIPSSTNKKLRLTYACLLINYAIFFLGYRTVFEENEVDISAAKAQCLSSAVELLSKDINTGVIYRGLVVLGTLLFRDEEMKAVASALDLSGFLDSLLETPEIYNDSKIRSTAEEIRLSLASATDA